MLGMAAHRFTAASITIVEHSAEGRWCDNGRQSVLRKKRVVRQELVGKERA